MVFTERYCVEAGIERCVEAVEKARRRSAIAVIDRLERGARAQPRGGQQLKLVDTLLSMHSSRTAMQGLRRSSRLFSSAAVRPQRVTIELVSDTM